MAINLKGFTKIDDHILKNKWVIPKTAKGELFLDEPLKVVSVVKHDESGKLFGLQKGTMSPIDLSNVEELTEKNVAKYFNLDQLPEELQKKYEPVFDEVKRKAAERAKKEKKLAEEFLKDNPNASRDDISKFIVQNDISTLSGNQIEEMKKKLSTPPKTETPKSGEAPNVEQTTRSGGSTTPPNETSKSKTKKTQSGPDGPSPKNTPPNKNTTNVNKLKAKKLGKLGKVNAILTAGIGVSSFFDNRNQGDGVVESAVKAAAETAVAHVVSPGMYLAGLGLMKAPELAVKGYEHLSLKARDMSRAGYAKPFQGNTFVDNKQIFTMRQAALVAMQQSKYNLEHAMQGNEASFLHR